MIFFDLGASLVVEKDCPRRVRTLSSDSLAFIYGLREVDGRILTQREVWIIPG